MQGRTDTKGIIMSQCTTVQARSTSPHHYYDIESLAITSGLPKSARRNSKDKTPSTIWKSTTEVEKSRTGSLTRNSKNQTKPKKPDKPNKTVTDSIALSPLYLENPLLHNNKTWILPRVELWCKDPHCVYNRILWENQNQSPDDNRSPDLHPNSSRLDGGSNRRSSSTHYCTIGDTCNMQSSSVMAIQSPHRNGLKIPASLQMHMKRSMGMETLNFRKPEANKKTNYSDSLISKTDNTFTSSSSQKSSGRVAMTQSPTNTMGSSTSSKGTTESALLSAQTNTSSSGSEEGRTESSRPARVSVSGSSGYAMIPGYDSSTASGSGNPVGHDTGSSHNKANNGQQFYKDKSSLQVPVYNSQQPPHIPTRTSSNPLCPNCSGVISLQHFDANSQLGLPPPPARHPKSTDDFWHLNKISHPLQRDHSFHSVGGFTLNGQYNATIKKQGIVKFCSSHKISLVVSTFSLLATIGLLITLLLMKKRGMMDTVMDQ